MPRPQRLITAPAQGLLGRLMKAKPMPLVVTAPAQVAIGQLVPLIVAAGGPTRRLGRGRQLVIKPLTKGTVI